MKNKLKDFINLVKTKYPINFSYEYDSEEDFYYIWHDGDEELINSDNFVETIGIFMDRVFWESDIFNIGLGYDPDKFQKIWMNMLEDTRINTNCIIQPKMDVKINRVDDYRYSESEYLIKPDISIQYYGKKMDIPIINSTYEYNGDSDVDYIEGAA